MPGRVSSQVADGSSPAWWPTMGSLVRALRSGRGGKRASSCRLLLAIATLVLAACTTASDAPSPVPSSDPPPYAALTRPQVTSDVPPGSPLSGRRPPVAVADWRWVASVDDFQIYAALTADRDICTFVMHGSNTFGGCRPVAPSDPRGRLAGDESASIYVAIVPDDVRAVSALGLRCVARNNVAAIKEPPRSGFRVTFERTATTPAVETFPASSGQFRHPRTAEPSCG